MTTPPVATRRAALGAAATALARPAAAQPRFPQRPIRVVVPFAPGGTTDVQMRALCEGASRRLGQPIIVDNRPGAGGTLGPAQLLQAQPDGYTLAQMPLGVFRYPHMVPRRPFDPLTDFTWIIHLTGYLFGVAVRADSPWRSWQDFITHAKANPGKIDYGTPGVGTSLHITMEQIAEKAGIDWVHVPFRGASENLQALLGGQIHASAESSAWGQLVEDGRLRLLVTWGAERAKRFPDVPTLREVGIDIVSSSPYGLAGPKGMNPETVRILHDAFKEALHDPAHLAVLDRYDMQVVYMSSEDYATFARRTYEEEGRTIQRLGLRL